MYAWAAHFFWRDIMSKADDQPSIAAQAQLSLSASDAVAAIANGSLGAVDYMHTLLEQVRAQAGLNSLITVNAAAALDAAAQVDAARAAGHALPPLAGLPIVVKDNIDARGMPTTAGTPALRDWHPAVNAPSVQRLLDAGAIILGKANMHELAFGATSTNFSSFAGHVKNPYDSARIPGGSSGGTAAAIAARIAPAGLGTDTGGSTRVPAALCGIVGLRPSVGDGGIQRRYDSGGTVPISHTRDTVGPMARTVADVALLDSVLSGLPVPSPEPLAGLRFGVPAAFWQPLDADVAAVMAQARKTLAQASVVLVDIGMEDVMALNGKVSFPLALHEPRQAIPAYLAASGAQITLDDIAAQVASPDVRHAFGAILGDAFGAAYPDALQVQRPRLQALYRDYFARHRLDAIFFPTTPVCAVAIDGVQGSSVIAVADGAPGDAFTTLIRNTDPASNAGLPGLSLPAGMTAAGLPVGMEIDGPLASDSRLLAIGLSLEALFGPLPAPPACA
jgi:mandelamide amidase